MRPISMRTVQPVDFKVNSVKTSISFRFFTKTLDKKFVTPFYVVAIGKNFVKRFPAIIFQILIVKRNIHSK